MSDMFGAEYAQQYDLLYRDKDYDAEVALLARLFAEAAVGPGSAVLDLGCGTGQHALRLARAGYRVTGVDRSAAMLRLARVKAEQQLDETIPQPQFVHADLTTVRLGGEPFDAAIMMFNVLGYQVTNQALREALRSVRAHLRAGGLFVCDVWYGPAVLAVRPSERTKVVPTGDGQIIRSVRPTLDVLAHRADVEYRVWRLRGREVVADMSELHRLRYFFPQELALLLEDADMELTALRGVGAHEGPPTESTWTVVAVGRAR